MWMYSLVNRRFKLNLRLLNVYSLSKLLSVKSVRYASQGFFRKLPDLGDEKDEIFRFPSDSVAKQALERYHNLTEQTLKGGGPKGIERHVQKNKKVLIRDRIKALLDDDSPFLEIGALAGFDMPYGDVPAAGVVAGVGKIHGVYCMISGNDATVKGGSYYPITVTKSYRIQEIAEQIRLPTVYMPDSGGAFLPLQSEIFPDKKHGGRNFYNQAIMSSKGIHQVALVCGSCTAGGAYNPTMCDEAIIVNKIGKIFLAGPPLVKAATGEVVSDEDLGGAFVHSGVSGCTDYFASDEDEAFNMCRDIVYALNMNVNEPSSSFLEPNPELPWIDVAESKDYFLKLDLYLILSGLLDGSRFNEFKALYGQQAIAGFGSIEGQKVGVVANVGDVGSKEAIKISHLVNICTRRKLPLIFVQNCKLNESSARQHFPDTTESEAELIKRRGALSSFIATCSVPKIALTVSGLSQDGSVTMCGPSFEPTFHFMWPQAKLTSFEMTSSNEGPLVEDSFYAASNMLVDAVIPPWQTRSTISLALQIARQQNRNPEPSISSGVIRM